MYRLKLPRKNIYLVRGITIVLDRIIFLCISSCNHLFFLRDLKKIPWSIIGIFEHTIELYFSFFADLYVVLRFEYILLKTIQQMFYQVVTYLYHQVLRVFFVYLQITYSLGAQSFPDYSQNVNRGFVISTGILMENLPEGSAMIRH